MLFSHLPLLRPNLNYFDLKRWKLFDKVSLKVQRPVSETDFLNRVDAQQYLVCTYWGSESENHTFDVMVEGQVLKTEELFDNLPLTFYEVVYELPAALTKAKEQITVRFQAKPGFHAGTVFELKVTADPNKFPNYAFY